MRHIFAMKINDISDMNLSKTFFYDENNSESISITHSIYSSVYKNQQYSTYGIRILRIYFKDIINSRTLTTLTEYKRILTT